MSDEFSKLFPNASRDAIARNRKGAGQAAELESNSEHGAIHPRQVQDRHPAQFLVCITSVRQRLLDEDNLCEKYHVDCCRYAGLIPDDSPQSVKIETRQRKAEKGESEHTLIEIFEICNPPLDETGGSE